MVRTANPRSRRCFAAFVLLCWALVPVRAQAYCLARSCNQDATAGRCRIDIQTGCSVDGVALRKPGGCVYFGVQAGAAALTFGMSDAAFEDAIVAAFERWQNVDCGGGAHPSIEVISVGPVEAETPFHCGSASGGNLDVWLVSESVAGSQAVQRDTGAAAAVTHARHDGTGLLYDTDVSLNAVWFWLWEADEQAAALQVVATHEAGHVLGIAHSMEPDALMYHEYVVSPDRVLTADDVAAVCTLYPPSEHGEARCAPPVVRAAATREQACDGALQDGGGGVQCGISVARGSDPSPGPMAAVLTLLGLGLLYRRRRRATPGRLPSGP